VTSVEYNGLIVLINTRGHTQVEDPALIIWLSIDALLTKLLILASKLVLPAYVVNALLQLSLFLSS